MLLSHDKQHAVRFLGADIAGSNPLPKQTTRWKLFDLTFAQSKTTRSTWPAKIHTVKPHHYTTTAQNLLLHHFFYFFSSLSLFCFAQAEFKADTTSRNSCSTNTSFFHSATQTNASSQVKQNECKCECDSCSSLRKPIAGIKPIAILQRSAHRTDRYPRTISRFLQEYEKVCSRVGE